MAIVNPSTPPSEAERAIPSSRYSLPLYDPLGLGSPSNDELDNAHASQSQQRSNTTLHSSAGHGPVTPVMEQALRSGRRGRRRRSSEFAHTNIGSRSGSHSSNERTDSPGKAADEPLLWWQRSQQGSDKLQSVQVNETARARLPVLAPLETKSTPQPSSSPSPSIRSPAAAFLSSMNESLGSPPSQAGTMLDNERGYSISPIRSSSQSYRLSMPMMSSLHGPDEFSLGLASVATQMVDAGNVPKSRSVSSSLRPDEEGARIGPDGRYMLGRTIGFGGFSTIREAWDLGPGAEKKETADCEDLHRVAVKIVYSTDQDRVDDAAREDEELQIWNTIPAHPNLLPLLHHERIIVDQSVSGANKTQAISFLVMPYCEGSLLAYVKSEGSLPDNAESSPSIQSLSRGGSLKNIKTPSQQYESSLRQQSAYARTGSGFIPRSAGMRVASVPLSSVLGQSPSTSATPSSSQLLRRGSSRLSRAPRITNGVPFSAARKVMQQVTEALTCLHTRAGILHGDLKLENVLGQRSTSLLHRGTSRSGKQEADSDDEASMQDFLSMSESICWRVADFGLARKVSSDGRARKSGTQHYTADMQERSTMARQGKITVGGAGGSLAYTAPETFLPSAQAVDKEEADVSPFAPDMWALGCILYVLSSGRLPFSDSFEPRLQMKIAKGTWEMPNRLRRRTERKNSLAGAGQGTATARRERSTSGYVASESMSRTSSLSASFAAYKPPHSVNATTGPSTVTDMSASMPALQERHFFENSGMRSGSDQSIVDYGIVVAPFAVNEQEESSAESDDDEQIDRQMDGTSRDRLSIRLILRKLLEPDPRKRWTIEQLASYDWISEAAPPAFTVLEQESSRRLSSADDNAALPASFLGHSMSKRPSVAHPSISEHTSQEVTPTCDEAGDGGDEHDYRRGRSMRRDSAAGSTGPAKPIDIDRSTSRSHSRPRATRTDSLPWEMAGSFERALQMAGPWEQPPSRRLLHRSTSADTHGVSRGTGSPSKERRSASRPPRLEAVKPGDQGRTERSPAPPTSTSTRGSDGSASRSSTSRSRSRARDTLFEIASRAERKESSDDRLWWQRGRKSAR